MSLIGSGNETIGGTLDSNNTMEDNDAATGTSATSASNNTNTVPTCSLLTCSFNQDGGCLAIGTTLGFSVHNLYPSYCTSVRRDLSGGGIGLVEMLFRCNLMALVGGGPQPHAPSHRVLIWDDHIPKEIGELSFRQTVLSVKLRKDSIAVALRDRIYVYHLADLSLRDKIYTADNPHGLLCLSTQIHDMILACPSVTTGHVRVELYGLRKTILLEAHETSLRYISLTADGSKLATASQKGTVIRIWDVQSSSCIMQFRRGLEPATITCLCWSWDYSYLGCTSDKGTAHVFQLNNNNNNNNNNGMMNNTQQNQQQYHKSNTQKKSFTNRLFSSVKKTMLEGDANKKSICQIRGIPHPQACAFVSEAVAVNDLILAVAGFDADGNGVLLLSQINSNNNNNNNSNNPYYNNNHSYNTDNNSCNTDDNDNEPKRIGYHILCRSPQINNNISSTNEVETEEEKRRRRLRGWKPSIPIHSNDDTSGGASNGGDDATSNINITDRLDTIMQQIHFNEEEQDDEFEIVTVTTTTAAAAAAGEAEAAGSMNPPNVSTNNNTDGMTGNDNDINTDDDNKSQQQQYDDEKSTTTTRAQNNNRNKGQSNVNAISDANDGATTADVANDGDDSNGNTNSNAIGTSGASTIGDSIRTESLGTEGSNSNSSNNSASGICSAVGEDGDVTIIRNNDTAGSPSSSGVGACGSAELLQQ